MMPRVSLSTLSGQNASSNLTPIPRCLFLAVLVRGLTSVSNEDWESRMSLVFQLSQFAFGVVEAFFDRLNFRER